MPSSTAKTLLDMDSMPPLSSAAAASEQAEQEAGTQAMGPHNQEEFCVLSPLPCNVLLDELPSPVCSSEADTEQRLTSPSLKRKHSIPLSSAASLSPPPPLSPAAAAVCKCNSSSSVVSTPSSTLPPKRQRKAVTRKLDLSGTLLKRVKSRIWVQAHIWCHAHCSEQEQICSKPNLHMPPPVDVYKFK